MSSPLARACSSAITAQSMLAFAMRDAPTSRSRQTLPLGSGTPTAPPAASARLASFKPRMARCPAGQVALLDDDLAVDLVGGRREQPVGHHVVEHLRHDAVFAHQRKSFSHRLDGAAEHEIVGDLDRGRGRRVGPGLEDAAAIASNSGLQRATLSGGPATTIAGLAGDAPTSGRPSIGDAIMICPRSACAAVERPARRRRCACRRKCECRLSATTAEARPFASATSSSAASSASIVNTASP